MMEAQNGGGKLIFGDFQLERESRALWLCEAKIHLAKRPFDILSFLIDNRDRVVSRHELLDKFWEGHDVYDDALRKCIASIRKALRDVEKPPHFIETRYGSGFRFIGTVQEIPKNGNGDQAAPISEAGLQQAENLKRPLNEETAKRSRRGRYVLVGIAAAGLLIFVSFGFFGLSARDETDAAVNGKLSQADPMRSIAILPLKNLTGDPNNDYLSDGVTESIITELSRVDELRTVSRSSTFALKGKDIDPREIGKKLNVDSILEGSVQKKADLLSVNVRLISTEHGRVLWTSQEFERPAATAYELQEIISRNTAIALRTKLSDAIAMRNTKNADAYQAYLKGRFQWNKRTSDGIKKSIQLYERAIALDPDYALPYAGLAESYVQGIWHVPFVPKEVLPKAKNAALKALELDDTLAETHAALANIHELNWNWSEAERELQRAIEIDPYYARAYHVQAFCFWILGRYSEAVAAIERAEELDPLNLVISTDKAQVLFGAGRIDDAFRQWKKTLELDPNFVLAYEQRAIVNDVLGNESAAIEDTVRAMELKGLPQREIAAYRQTASRHGLKSIHRKSLKSLLLAERRGEYVVYVYLAAYHNLLGQKEDAFKYLEKAYKARSAEIVIGVTGPQFSSLRSDPRYAHLRQRAGLP